MMGWGDLVEETGQRQLWELRLPLIVRNGEESLLLRSFVWRTLRMDISVNAFEPDLWNAQEEIFSEIVSLAVNSLDLTKRVRWETITNRDRSAYEDQEPDMQTSTLIIRVLDGHEFEPVINMLARFKEARTS